MFNFLTQDQGPKDRPLTEYEYIEYLETGGGTNKTQLDKIDMTIRMTDRDAVSLPADSFLQVNYTITDVAGAPITVGEVAPVNGGWNLFKRAKFLLNDEEIEDIYNPGYVRQVKGLIEYSDDFERGQGQQELWMPDRPSSIIVGSLEFLTFRVPVDGDVNITGTAVSPHVINITTTQAAATPVVLMYGNQIVRIQNDTQGIADINSFGIVGVAGVQSIATLTVTDLAVNDVLSLYVGDNLLLIEANDGVTGVTGSFVGGAAAQLQFLDDTAGNAALTGFYAQQNSPTFDNIGFQKRRERALGVTNTTNRQIALWMPLRRLFPFLKENPTPFKGISMEIQFDINDMNKLLHVKNGAPQAKIEIHRFSWWVPVMKLSLENELKFNNFLKADIPRAYRWNAIQHYKNAPSKARDAAWLIKTTSHRPTRCYVFFQLDSKWSNQAETNMTFDHMNLQRIFITVNSDRAFPRKEYRIDYGVDKASDENYSRAYASYLHACMAIHSEDCKPAISYDDFKSTYPLYFFDLENQDSSVWENSTQAAITVEWVLKTEPNVDFRVHAVLETEREILLSGVNGQMTKVK